ncbi:glycosyltransferase family 2 protein [Petralouisia muris]|uniref:glycosyltransferase family 2 protein n=1 Tax=Petralouisia muris TaxID=3032872 RepID=UPI0014418F5A|nr:glycosyltransferase family 2 protein [Petralouisia muris]
MFMSVCIPTYNRDYILERAVCSVLNQTEKDLELIVVDDGSTDSTRSLMEKYKHDSRVKYCYKDNGGKHTALNRGIQTARGDFFLILDSDDMLAPNCIERMKNICMKYNLRKKKNICGVLGKCQNMSNGQILGSTFEIGEDGYKEMSYIDLHFRNKKQYGDCCECVKTSLLKEFYWPEDIDTKFIPESYVFDQIGLKYSLCCVNEIFEIKEYQEDGITKNNLEFARRNNLGFLYNYVNKIEDIFKKSKIPLKKKISIWRLYWNAVKLDSEVVGARVKRLSFIGIITYLALPILNRMKS